MLSSALAVSLRTEAAQAVSNASDRPDSSSASTSRMETCLRT